MNLWKRIFHVNAKIKLLAEQAKASVPAGLLVNEWIDEYNRIFAELIVRECAGIASEYDAPKMSGPGMIIANRIESHFGVEE